MAWIFLATDKTLDDAHQRLGNIATNINMYTMDNQGNLAYVHGGRYPRRAPGHDSRLPAPGDGPWNWRGLRPYSENPTVRNPLAGYIANWNNRPSGDWISSDLWTYTWGRADRGRIIFDLIEGESRPTVATVSNVNHSITFADVSAPFILPYLFSAWDGVTPNALEAEALAALRDWNRQWMVDAGGNFGSAPTVIKTWLEQLLTAALKDDVGEQFFHLYSATNAPSGPLGPSIPTPVGLKVLVRNLDTLSSGSDPDFDFFNGENPQQIIRESFSAAVAVLAREQGSEPDQWQLAAYPMSWQPFNFRGVPQALESSAHSVPAYLNRGSENNLFVATGNGIEAMDAIPPGQSGFVAPGGIPDEHTADQMEMYLKFDFKPVPFSTKDVKAGAVSETSLLMPR